MFENFGYIQIFMIICAHYWLYFDAVTVLENKQKLFNLEPLQDVDKSVNIRNNRKLCRKEAATSSGAIVVVQRRTKGG